MSNILKTLAAGSASEPTDEYFNQTTLLLHGDGTNGAQNNTFLDSSTNNFTITRNGNTTQGSFSPFSVADGEWSNYFDGTGDYLDFRSSNVSLTGAFTAECWVYNSGVNSPQILCYGEATTYNHQIIRIVSGYLYTTGYGATITGTEAVPSNEWVHLAVTRDSGGTIRLFTNGILNGSSTPSVTTAYAGMIGAVLVSGTAYDLLTGYVSNLRIVNGTCLYTSSFTPSTSPFNTNTSNQVLLTCYSNRFVDANTATTAKAITVTGNPSVQPFSPFAPSAAYDPSVNGGSGYFDGSGDSLTIADNVALDLGSSNFTIECWIYPTSISSTAIVFCKHSSSTGSWIVYRNGTTMEFYCSSDGSNWNIVNGATIGSISANAWYHIEITRDGNSFRCFLNGVLGSTTTSSATVYDGTQAVALGINPGNSVDAFTGYISNARILKGTALHTSAFTPPTAPLTAIANTSLLCNFTNAGILDNTGKNNLETVADAQIDTTTKKYGTGSMEFDGTGDWLKVPNSPDIQLGTGNFTIEFWVYLATGDTGSARGLVAKGGASTGWLVSLDSSQKVVFTYTTSTITSSGAITTNAWNHIAVVREGTGSNQTKIYIGGTNDGTGTVSTNFNQTEVMYIGANRAAGDPMKGFIDDLRITKGVARYTANFTPPTAAFPNL